MNQIRFASIFAALLAAVMLAGCAKTNEVASTEATPAGDAAAPESDTATAESATGSSEATDTAASAEGDAPKN